jgi:hypothetical protein
MTENQHITLTHHMQDETAEVSALELFRVKFPYTRVYVDDHFMNYCILRKQLAKSILKEAEELIKANKFPLTARLVISITDANLIIETK